jgi:tetratricopeptide (TPR) repeat protein
MISDPAPFAFLSSVFEEPEGKPLPIRERIWTLGQTYGRPIWAADFPLVRRAQLGGLSPLDKVDECLRNIQRSQIFICLLHKRHGTGVGIPGTTQKWGASYFELEVFEAVLLGMPIYVFESNVFAPERPLRDLLDMLGPALHLPARRLSDDAIVEEVERLLAGDVPAKARDDSPKRQYETITRVVRSFARGRGSGRTHLTNRPELEFLGGRFQAGTALDIDKTDRAIAEARAESNKLQRLTRLWIAIRELANAPYARRGFEDFLPLWNAALGEWANAGSWYGLHAHLYMGCLAALGSMERVRASLRELKRTVPESLRIAPHGALASEFYAMAKYLERGKWHKSALSLAGEHIDAAMRVRGGDRAGQLGIRASIRLALGDRARAVTDYRRALSIRNAEAEGDDFIGDAESELGFALLSGRGRSKGLAYQERGVERLTKVGNRPGLLVRAKRKLAISYTEGGDFRGAVEQLAGAHDAAIEAGLLDQLLGLRLVAMRLADEGADLPPALL